MKAKLILKGGRTFSGQTFGYEAPAGGEAVFSTAMVGYPESLTDPSYNGQILCVTYPLVGNYGVPENALENGLSKNFESEKIWVKGLVVSDYSSDYSHFDAVKSLGDWLKENKIPAICGVDTRELTKVLREEGSMTAQIVPEGCTPLETVEDPGDRNQTSEVSCKEVLRYGEGEKRVVVVDCGVKHNILRCLIERNVEVVRVPWDYDFLGMDYDGLLISNGPGDPSWCDVMVEHIRQALNMDKPVFGICMGNQLLARAGGAKTFKLKYGHRSHNQPVRMVGSDKCLITSQNHGYAVDPATLGKDWEPWFVNMNDGTNEGIRHKSKPFFSVQFHPEASGGPTDASFIFDQFISLL